MLYFDIYATKSSAETAKNRQRGQHRNGPIVRQYTFKKICEIGGEKHSKVNA